jgi:hypothetical protein
MRVKSTKEAPADLLREGHRLPLTDGKTIYLPEELEENLPVDDLDYYLVLAAHQAGFIEFGTFELDIDALSAVSPADLPDFDKSGSLLASHYELFFKRFENPALARDIFFAVEDGRVDHFICARYRGLAVKLKRVCEHSLGERPLPAALAPIEAIVECITRLSLGENPEHYLPSPLRRLWEDVRRICERALNITATVVDSAIAAIQIYLLLKGYWRRRLESSDKRAERPEIDSAADGFESAGEYLPAAPVDFRGQTDPGRVQMDAALDIVQEFDGSRPTQELPLTAEALKELLARGAKIKILGVNAEELSETAGLFATDLKGLLQEKLKELSPEEKKKLGRLLQRLKAPLSDEDSRVYYYDEWDYLAGAYKARWCQLREIAVEAGSLAEVARIRRANSALIASVKRHYQRIRPEMLKKVKRLRDGEEVELDHAIDAIIDYKIGLAPSDRIYQNRERRARDIATCFLLDLSASTDEWVAEEPHLPAPKKQSRPQAHPFSFFPPGAPEGIREELCPPEGAKRVIDIEREALIIMAEALEHLGDEYAIFGFSGYGKDNVEFLPLKKFSETYSDRVRRRIGALEPRKSTRMGPAIRHAIEKLGKTGRKMKILILLSDGYPQDFDYGPDRSSREYGLHDTAAALREARKRDIHTFLITVDQAGNDYLYDMCGGRDYFVVKQPSSLPKILPRLYRKLTF